MAGDNSLIIEINGTAKDFIDEIDKVKKKTESLEKVLTKTAKVSALAFAGFAASIALVTKAFANYETALVGVGKTTNIEGKRLDKFGKQFQKLASEIPVSTNELLGIAQAAGQLGIEGEENLLKFTETIAKLGVATDLTGEQAATSLARLLGLTKESVGSIDKLGSVIVALGNSSKASESEIVKMALSVAKSTSVFNVSSGEAAAFGTVLKELGQEAQLGGSVIGKSFLKIQKAIDDGGPALENLANLTGIAGDQLKKTFEDDAAGVFRAFLSGIGSLEGGTSAIFGALEAFGLKGDEVNKILPALAQNTELLNKAFKTTAAELENATALNKEAEAAFATLSSTFQKTQNNATNLATNIGAQLAPEIDELLGSLNGVLKSLSEIDEETISVIASFLKWGAIITGTIAAITAFLVGALQVSVAITAIGAAFLPATISASAFWIALTGPIGIAVLGIAAVTAAVIGLSTALNDGFDTSDSLEETNKKLDELRKKLEANKKIAEDTGKDPSQSIAVKQIQARIDKLEELRKKQIETNKTPIDLTRPSEDPLADILAPKIGGLPDEQIIPFRPEEQEGEVGKKSTENLKKTSDDNQAIIDSATQKRIDSAKRENEELKALQLARIGGATEEELAFAQRRQEIDAELIAAKQIKNAEERQLAVENLGIKHEQELAALDEFDSLKDEREAQRREEKAALDEELRSLDKEQQALFNQEDQEVLQSKIDSQQEAEKKAASDKLNKQIQTRNKFKQDELKFGTEVATLKKFFASEEVQGFKSVSGQLAQLSQSRNSTQKAIGKAAARVNAAIATSEGAIKAYASLSGIPIIGPALGVAAAASLIAFGVEQQGNISRMQTGGFVPPTNGGARDRFPTLLEPNELVVPASVAPNFIQAAGIPDTQGREAVGDQGDQGTPVLEIMLDDRAGEMISLEQREGRSLGLIGDE